MSLLMRKMKEVKNRSGFSAKKKASPEGPACEGLRRGCLKGRFLMRCNIILCKCEEVNSYCNKCNLHCTEAWPPWIGIASDYGAPRIGPAHDDLQFRPDRESMRRFPRLTALEAFFTFARLGPVTTSA